MQTVDVVSSTLASTARGWRGSMGARHTRQPEKLLQLYEFEGCPFCRLTREALTELDLDAIIYPCPKGGTRFRPRAEAVGGKQQFPLLVDDNTDEVRYESADIIAYLREQYAGGRNRGNGSIGKLEQWSAGAATALRGFAGVRAAGATGPAPEQPLELYSFESSPFSRLAREALCELEVPYILRNMGKAKTADMGPPWVRRYFFPNTPVEGRNRQRMMAQTGRLQVPYLIDPNTGRRLYESDAIVAYLHEHYGRG